MQTDEPPAKWFRAFLRIVRPALTAAFLISSYSASNSISPAASPNGGEQAVGRRPNVLLIVTDDHSALTLGAEGDRHGATPNLDALIRQGVYFDRAYCNSPLCTPSRQSFISGKLPHAVGVTRLLTQMPEEVQTLGHWLGRDGYQTAAVGKMHFNGPSRHGFGLRRDYPHWLKHLDRHPPDGGDLRKPWRPMVDPTPVWLNARCEDAGLSTEAMDATYFVNRSLRFVHDQQGKPFALVTGFYEPHAPFHFPREWRGRYRADQFASPRLTLQDRREQPKLFQNLTDAEFQGIQAAYYTSVGFVDEQIGRLVREIDADGLGGDTLIVFLSDNGYMLGQHGRFEKHCFYEPSVRVPLIMRWTGRLPAGRRVHDLVELADVLPTVLGLLDVPIPAGLHGVDLSALARGEPGGRGRDVVVSEYQENEEAMARSARYKLIVGSGRRKRADGMAPSTPPSGPYERLYDEENDPNEDHDLADDPTLASVKETLLDSIWRRFAATWSGPESIPPGLSKRDAVYWCLTPRDKPNTGYPGHM